MTRLFAILFAINGRCGRGCGLFISQNCNDECPVMHGAANPGPRGQHQSRDQCGLRNFRARRPDTLYVGGGPFFNTRRIQIAILTARHLVPMTSTARDIAEVGGLMSYGSDVLDTICQVGVYTGRILKGAKPVELPVVQASKFALVINLQTARAFGLDVSPTLLARADEVIE